MCVNLIHFSIQHVPWESLPDFFLVGLFPVDIINSIPYTVSIRYISYSISNIWSYIYIYIQIYKSRLLTKPYDHFNYHFKYRNHWLSCRKILADAKGFNTFELLLIICLSNFWNYSDVQCARNYFWHWREKLSLMNFNPVAFWIFNHYFFLSFVVKLMQTYLRSSFNNTWIYCLKRVLENLISVLKAKQRTVEKLQ